MPKAIGQIWLIDDSKRKSACIFKKASPFTDGGAFLCADKKSPYTV